MSDLEWIAKNCRQVLTLFSGGLDSSYVLKSLSQGRCRVTALTVDIGDGANQADLEQIAHRFGAELLVADARETFAQDAVLPAIRANARYMGMYPISSSISRPIIARQAVETALSLGCDAIIHTANQSQNSLRRLNGAIQQLGYQGYYGTPYEFTAISREDKIAELQADGLSRFQARGISGDANLWCREFESGSLTNPEAFWVPESLFEWTSSRDRSLFKNEINITFNGGRPVAIDEEPLPLVELIARLNYHAGSFGIGRFSGLEHLEGGEKVLEIREAPAAMLLMDAYRQLETATLSSEFLREKISMEQLWVREAIEGRWFTPLRLAADAFMGEAARRINGVVGYQLRPGVADVCSIRASAPLYLTDRDAWEQDIAVQRYSRHLHEVPQAHESQSARS